MLTLHLVNRLLAVLLSLAIVLAAIVLGIEVVRWLLDLDPWLVPWDRWWPTLTDLRVDDQALLAVAAAVAVVGLLLLFFELKPRSPDRHDTAPLVDGVHTVVTRGGLTSAAETAARGVSGVRSASADVGRRTITVTARSRARGVRDELQPQVQDAVRGTIADLELVRPHKVRVRIEEDR
jgi:hypothetical protein